jgi:hypothetical protein
VSLGSLLSICPDGKVLGLVLGERELLPVEALEWFNRERTASGDNQSKGFSVQSLVTVQRSEAVTADPHLRDYSRRVSPGVFLLLRFVPNDPRKTCILHLPTEGHQSCCCHPDG